MQFWFVVKTHQLAALLLIMGLNSNVYLTIFLQCELALR